MLRRNPQGIYPKIDDSAYVDKTAVIIGDVSIGRQVFVGPGAVIRADEPGSSIHIAQNSNVQDRVIVHVLADSSAVIGENASLSHGCIVHGPCVVGKNCFVGFGAVVFNAELAEQVFVQHLAVVQDVRIGAGRFVPAGAVVQTSAQAEALGMTESRRRDFAERVMRMNLDLVRGYRNE